MVVVVLCPLFCFFYAFSSDGSVISGRAGYWWLHERAPWSSPGLALTAGCCRLGPLQCTLLSTVMPLNYFCNTKLTFAFFGFAAKNRSLVPLYNKLVPCNKQRKTLAGIRTLGQRLPEEGESRLTFSLTNEAKFGSPRTCWCHQTASSLQYLYFITDGDEGTLALCSRSEHWKQHRRI